MSDNLLPSYIGLAIRLFTLLCMIFYILPKQVKEAWKPNFLDPGLFWLNRNRKLILVALIGYSLSSLVPGGYQACRIVSCDSLAFLQDFSTIMSNIANLLVVGVLVLIYREK